jgi:hypothetical protein
MDDSLIGVERRVFWGSVTFYKSPENPKAGAPQIH